LPLGLEKPGAFSSRIGCGPIAGVQRRKGKVEDSIATTARAIDLDPRNARLLIQQATSYAQEV
jgi:hypothetical protein